MEGDRQKNPSIAIIAIHFGVFKPYINLYLRSCAYNPSIDFFIVTDQKVPNALPPNVHVVNSNLEKIKTLAEENLSMKITLSNPYKLCDYKPVWGLILADLVKGYDYWGETDLDVIYGDIRYFCNQYTLEKYDKFLNRGHLTLYRNTPTVNNYYKLKGSKCGNYKQVFWSSNTWGFDESLGINKIYEFNALPEFGKRIYVDVDVNFERFRHSVRSEDDINYDYQCFYWEKGKLWKSYINDNGDVCQQEYIYIHLQKRKLPKEAFDPRNTESFYITNRGFIEKEPGCPDKNEIGGYNEFKGVDYEKHEEELQWEKNKINTRRWYFERTSVGHALAIVDEKRKQGYVQCHGFVKKCLMKSSGGRKFIQWYKGRRDRENGT